MYEDMLEQKHLRNHRVYPNILMYISQRPKGINVPVQPCETFDASRIAHEDASRATDVAALAFDSAPML